MNPSRLYWKVIYHNAYFLLRVRPFARMYAIFQGHRFRSIGTTKVIGDRAFIGYCEEFSECLRKIDPAMYAGLFVENQFIFNQYSDIYYQNVLFAEYAVPSHYQKLKAKGVGAAMIYGFYSTTLSGRTVTSYLQMISRPGYSKIPKEQTYLWLTKHQFPEEIFRWYEQNLASYK